VSRRRSGAAAAGLLGAWLVLLALGRGAEATAAGLPGALGCAAALGTACLLPGHLLARRLGLGGAPWWQAVPVAFGLGIAFLLVPATAVLLSGSGAATLGMLVTGLTAALVLAELVRPSPPPLAPAPRSPAPPALAVLALLTGAAALAASAPGLGFTASGDEWTQMRTIRAFLEAPAQADDRDFEAWSLLAALMVRLGHAPLLEAYRLFLPPLLIAAAALSFHLLARSLEDDGACGALALALLALHALSDMHTRGEGLGMGLLVRIVEDKHVAAFVLVPLAQAATLRGLRARAGGWLACAAAVSLAAVVVHPLAAVWLLLTAGATVLIALATGQAGGRRTAWVLAGGLLAGGLAIAAGLRSLRPPEYFRLYEPSWPYNASFLRLSQNQLTILSLERGWFMADPQLLAHPFAVAAALAALALLPQARRSLGAAFLCASTLLPIALAYNPLTARLLGAVITPWMVYRVLWAVPAALALAFVARRLIARWASPAAQPWAAAGLVLLCAALLGGRLADARVAARERNHVRLEAGERAFLDAADDDRGLGGLVLAPADVAIHLPAFSPRLRPYAGLDVLRRGDPEPAEEAARFLGARSVDPEQLELLAERGITHVLAPKGGRLEAALRGQPRAFRLVWDGSSLALFAFRPERVSAVP
jgi:hypothetical protein